MIDRIINGALRNRLMVLVLIAGIAGAGYWAYTEVPNDSYPDVSPTLVQVFTVSPGLSPVDVETQISYPIEISMYGLPELERVQSTSIFGLSRVNVYFEDGTDIYFARRLVMERLGQARGEIPDGLGNPQLGPLTTGLGNILMYEVKNEEGADHSLTELRTAQDWIVKPRLRTVPGVTGVLSIGGFVRQYQVQLDMNELLARNLTVGDVRTALGANNRNVGASFLERGGEEYIVRGYGWIRPGEEGLDDIRNIVLRSHDGMPVYVSDVAEVAFGPEIRRGALKASRDLPSANQAASADTSGTSMRAVASGPQRAGPPPSEGAVGGFVQKLIGTNTQAVLGRVEEEITAINNALPEGMTLVSFYSQGTLVEKAVGTVTSSLAFGAMLVLLVLYLFMGDVRSTLIIVATVPLAFLVAFIGLWATGLSANLMTLGALAISIGMIGDGTTVVVENVYRLLEERKDTENVSMVRLVGEAAREVGRPVVFASSIIIIVFLPLFTLQGVEGKLFTPMAYTITFALLGAVVLAITFAPVASSYLVSPKQIANGEPWLIRWLKARFRPLAKWAVDRPKTILASVGVLFVASLALFPFLGTEFAPTLREGTYAVRAVLPPGANLESTEAYTERMQQVFQEFPEVESVHSRVGRAEVGGDPEPVNVVFNVVSLKPLDAWSSGRNYEELQTAMAERLQEQVPGVAANFSQPIQLRTDELLSGVRAQVVASLYGENLDTLATKAQEMAEVIRTVEGAVDVRAQQQGGKPQVLVRPDRQELARLGISVDDFLSTVETGIGGSTAGQVFEGIRRYDVFVRLQEEGRGQIEQVRQLPIRTAKGAVVPLEQVADVEVFTGPKQISRNKASRRTYVQLNVRGRDMGSVVEEIQEKIQAEVDLPPGYFTEYGGQFENQRRAMQRLYIVVPITLGLIFLMLFSTFGSLSYATLIFLNVPFATIGGIVALWLGGLYVSVPAAVGFIAVFGVAVLNGVVLVSYINQLREEGKSMREATVLGAELRLRPVLMTALTTSLGLLPLLLADAIGSNVQRPLAAVVIGGLVTSTLLTLFVLPSIYPWFAEDTADAAI
ncbi:CusA/CzcA family heavy metal efflux RND transporter [Longimonas halophila]|uniref:CusA/CzcA family heavy metal efflux RND transporter n=1 Tax=Longimonas halophila TaxID=1469170 RepID=A0A2H3NLW6_9BACT|nr:CusA/CzcA family heavy metal efflux RND transporter [Longimonas halophila]PEN05562.1 CusA/CzcA family heavy metal efflux RND transporter [Longimonas halophila]